MCADACRLVVQLDVSETNGEISHTGLPACPYTKIRGFDTMLLMIDPYYYQYEECMCLPGHSAVLEVDNGTVTHMECQHDPPVQVS